MCRIIYVDASGISVAVAPLLGRWDHGGLAYLWLWERLSQSSKRVGPMRGLLPGRRE